MPRIIEAALDRRNEVRCKISTKNVKSIDNAKLLIYGESYNFFVEGRVVEDTVTFVVPELLPAMKEGLYNIAIEIVADSNKYFAPITGKMKFRRESKIDVDLLESAPEPTVDIELDGTDENLSADDSRVPESLKGIMEHLSQKSGDK